MNKTAVQWLFEEYKKREIATDEIVELFVKAEQMEKEQIIESYCQGCWDITNNDIIFPRETSEQYYNEILKSK